MKFANGERVIWTSATGRARICKVLTEMATTPNYLVEVEQGSSLVGQAYVVPTHRLDRAS